MFNPSLQPCVKIAAMSLRMKCQKTVPLRMSDVYAQNELGTLLIDGEIDVRLGKAIPGTTNLLLELRRARSDPPGRPLAAKPGR